MVDFQSRDTTRGLGSDDEDDEDDAESTAEASPDGDQSADESSADAGSSDADDQSATEADEEAEQAVSDPDNTEAELGNAEAEPHNAEAEPSHENGVSGHAESAGHAHDTTVTAAVVTVSSSRAGAENPDDPAGDAVHAELADAGHTVSTRDVIADDYDRIQEKLATLVGRADIDVVVTTGGTGVTPDDVTPEAVTPLFGKELPGFGELFRLLSYDEVGTRALASRATAGIIDGVVVCCLPGSESAARLGARKLVAREAGHLASLASRE